MTLPRRAEAPPSGIPSWARVGQKVVCVDAGPGMFASEPLIETGIYTITGVTSVDKYGSLGLIVAEARAAHHPRWGYRISRFRPLITKSQSDDIAEFRKLLTGQPVRENERA